MRFNFFYFRGNLSQKILKKYPKTFVINRMMLYTNGLFFTLRNKVVYKHLAVVRQFDSS